MKKWDKIIDITFWVLMVWVTIVSFGNLIIFNDIMGGVVGVILITCTAMYLREVVRGGK